MIGQLTERDFRNLLAEGLLATGSWASVEVDRPVGNFRVDLLATTRDGRVTLIEVRLRAPLTTERLAADIAQLNAFGHAWSRTKRAKPSLVLAIPNSTIVEDRTVAIPYEGIQLWDREQLLDLIDKIPDSALSPAARDTKSLFIDSAHRAIPAPHGEELRRELRALPCGRAYWSPYQKLCADIFRYLFCPPLEEPIYESRNATGINRRDIILPNYATHGLWHFLHQAYRAEYIVVDAKNYCGRISKTQVLQLANYLSDAGTGLLGLILTREAEDRGAVVTRREQWLLHNKMILVLTDDDLHQMISSKTHASAPEELVRQKLQDFRLAI